ncbi:MAG: hypothetical protein AAC993_04865 [Dehalococcoides mccartyi]|uniref:hypothetical protein n=1 Tax=Dehalococcoides mccartyi TaxID=61435 RepID=UPI0030F61424
MSELKLSLIENALDFILSAIKYSEFSNPSDLKYAILHLSDGIELIFKERLRQEHWSLIFADTSKANQLALENGDFKSVDFNTCITLLKNIANISFSENDKTLLTELRITRNKVQHFEFTLTKEKVLALLVLIWSLILDFLHDHLNDSCTKYQNTIRDIKNKMINNEQFVNARMQELELTLKAHTENGIAIIECHECFKETLIIPDDGKNINCLFCKYHMEDDPEAVAQSWAYQFIGPSDPKDWDISNPIENCPECGRHTLICIPSHHNPRDSSTIWFCFACAESWATNQLSRCDYCNEMYTPTDGDISTCDSCIEERLDNF